MVAPDSVKNVAKSAVSKIVDYGYDDKNSGKSLKENVFGLADTLQPEIKDVALQAGKKVVDKVTSKLNEMSPDEVQGEGMRKKRFAKGSQEARDHMAKLRAMRGAKKGMGVKSKKRRGKGLLENIESTLIHTGIPTLGRVAGTLIGGVPAGMVGEELGNMAGDVIGEAVGRGLKNRKHTRYGGLTDGVPSPVVSEKSKDRVRTHGIYGKGKRIHGGSFLSL